VKVLDIKNRCLFSKWLFKIFNEDGVWWELLRNKYLQNKTLSQVMAKPRLPFFWKGLMGVKDELFAVVPLGEQSLAQQYITRYAIMRRENILVADVLTGFL
jgi:hypothetical protein